MRDRIPTTMKKLFEKVDTGKASPRMAIKAFCLECMGYQRTEVTHCTAPECPLYTHRPFQKRASAGTAKAST